jgi:hypothetical protein
LLNHCCCSTNPDQGSGGFLGKAARTAPRKNASALAVSALCMSQSRTLCITGAATFHCRTLAFNISLSIGFKKVSIFFYNPNLDTTSKFPSIPNFFTLHQLLVTRHFFSPPAAPQIPLNINN